MRFTNVTMLGKSLRISYFLVVTQRQGEAILSLRIFCKCHGGLHVQHSLQGENYAIAGQECYLGKVRIIRSFVPNCKLDFGSHLWDTTVPGVARQSILADVNKTR